MINQGDLACTLQHNGKTFVRLAKVLLSGLVLTAIMMSNASAHLMVAQNGTLNFKANGVFMVLSLPVSAFKNIDDDGDGKMSAAEFSKHKPAIMSTVKNNIRLSDKQGARPLQDLILSPVVSHIDEKAPTDQLIVMGRFALANEKLKNDADTIKTKSNELRFYSNLFGKTLLEKSLLINATRKLPSAAKAQKYKLVLTPKHTEGKLFTSLK